MAPQISVQGNSYISYERKLKHKTAGRDLSALTTENIKSACVPLFEAILSEDDAHSTAYTVELQWLEHLWDHENYRGSLS